MGYERLINWTTMYDRGDGGCDEIYTIPQGHISSNMCTCPNPSGRRPTVEFARSMVAPHISMYCYRQLGPNQQRLVDMIGAMASKSIYALRKRECPLHSSRTPGLDPHWS